MNAMYDRLLKSFPGLVGLEHRRSTLALYRRLLEDGNSKVLSFKQAKWARTLSRLYYFPVRVLSPYQMLKAPYRLKGYESILTDLLGAACVLMKFMLMKLAGWQSFWLWLNIYVNILELAFYHVSYNARYNTEQTYRSAWYLQKNKV